MESRGERERAKESWRKKEEERKSEEILRRKEARGVEESTGTAREESARDAALLLNLAAPCHGSSLSHVYRYIHILARI